jgi:phosphate butyryltransferase
MAAPQDFDAVIAAAAAAPPCSYIVAGGEAEDIVEAIELCKARGIEGFTLVGDLQQTAWLLATRVLDDDVRIEPSSDPAADAMRLCSTLPNPVLVKGRVDSGALLKGVLGLLPKDQRPFLSHVILLPHPSARKLLALTDGGLNIAPDLQQKAAILDNALNLLAALGEPAPRVLLAAAMEDKGQPIPSIADARELRRLHETGLWPQAVIDGPYGLDIGLAPDAVAAKGIGGRLGGLADLVLMPNIEACNFAAKMAGIIQGPPWAAVVVGGPLPVIVGSRSDPPESRVASLAVARLIAGKLPPGRLPGLPAGGA